MTTRPFALAAGLLVALGQPALASYRVVDFTQAQGTKATGVVDPLDNILMRGAIPPGRAVSNTLSFKPKQPKLKVRVSWQVGPSSAAIRLIGVNVDLLNAAGTVVASDGFTGVLAETATSSLSFDALKPNATYRLRLTGQAQGVGAYTITLRTAP